jgi:hypothetical protein
LALIWSFNNDTASIFSPRTQINIFLAVIPFTPARTIGKHLDELGISIVGVVLATLSWCLIVYGSQGSYALSCFFMFCASYFFLYFRRYGERYFGFSVVGTFVVSVLCVFLFPFLCISL